MGIFFDFIKFFPHLKYSWRRDKYRKPIQSYETSKNNIEFYLKPQLISKRKDFLSQFNGYSENELYYAALDYINPRNDLLFGIIGDK